MSLTMDDNTSEINNITAIEAQEVNIVSKFGLVPFRDGNAWCFLLGEDIQSGICGFGDSPSEAARDFNASWNKKI